ncbi:DUF4240 domain-containing protein [Muricauda sp. SCSIO 64092]|uniref:DUF4240 domain-containing protein n=1 Tax=Allomuricauda sp. SCSIO 64092 TaxID=2908842 RepID=UPI001FF4C5D4|nr:DUF4240 domain-containing protein [Muricauda sp. SCSIO 64092]UOY05025.1 DUF4240 domain-containing protein [Muricauda sp. SCSIO 64092]
MEQENDKNIANYAAMDETTFWELIESSRRYSTEINTQNDRLELLISNLSPKEIVGFSHTMERLYEELGDSCDYMDFAEFEQGKRPEESDNIKYLIISLGEEHYYAVKENPGALFYRSDYTWAVDNLHVYADIDRSHSVFYEKTNQSLSNFTDTIDRLEELEQDHDHAKEQDNDQEVEP